MNSMSEVKEQPVDYVNPYMGNISHLLVPTYPTIHVLIVRCACILQRDDYTAITMKGLPGMAVEHRMSALFFYTSLYRC